MALTTVYKPDNVKTLLGTGNDLEIYHDGTNSNINNATGSLRIQVDEFRVKSQDNNENIIRGSKDGNVELYYDNVEKFRTNPGGIKVSGNIACDGDNQKLILGAGDDLQIYHDGSNSHIHQDGTGDLQIRSDNSIEFNTNGTENAIWCDTNGAVKLYYDNSKKFETTTNGATVTGHISGAHGVMEQFFTVCDGSTIALASGNKTVENVTADMDLTSTFADIPGSTLAYTPPTGAKQVIFEFHYYGTFKDPNVIWHHKLFLDSDEVTMARGTFRANEAFTDRIVMKWAFNIGGTAATASGRVASWTSDKTIKMQAREFGSSSEGYLHRLANWDGSTTDEEAPDAAMPCIGITAIG